MQLSTAQQEIVAFYEGRTHYDTDLTVRRALRLVEVSPTLQPGQEVLDVATGTAIVAIAIVKQIGSTGKVVGVDFCPGMLQQARGKIAAADIQNIELMEADIEKIQFPEASFDAIFCSSAIVLFSDIPTLLKRWYNWLKPGGFIAFSCYAETSFMTPTIRQVCQEVHQIDLPNLHEPVGKEDRCSHLLEAAGFSQINIITEQWGEYLTIEKAKQFWTGKWLHPLGHPLSQLPPEDIQKLILAYQVEVEKLATNQGVWLDNLLFFVRGKKLNKLEAEYSQE